MLFPSFTRHFGVPTLPLMRYGVFDPILNSDTKLFIDPLLLPTSAATEFSDQASDLFQQHFVNVFKLMRHSKQVGDAAWNGAKRLVDYKELRYTCLGYGNKSIRGSSLSEEKQARILKIAKQISDIGMEDPYLLPLLSLIEDGIGPDQISDMTTNIVCPAICDYTNRICKKFGVPTQTVEVKGATYELPVNPYEPGTTPILLLPMDVLKTLPVASSWGDIGAVSAHNQQLRDELNDRLAFLFQDTALTEIQKQQARDAVLGDRTLLELLSNALKTKSKDPYDFDSDVEGFLTLQRLFEELPKQFQFTKVSTPPKSVSEVVKLIIEEYRRLIEEQGLWKELWGKKGTFKNESAMQRLFFVVASAFCTANNLDLSPEPDSGSGRIDFKMSKGASDKAIVEIKKANNSHLRASLETQLCHYCVSESASEGYYVVLDPGYEDAAWYEKLEKDRVNLQSKYSLALHIEPIDAARRTSPSIGHKKIPYGSKK